MSWKIEIYRAFFVAFGAMEFLTNINYLLSPIGISNARKQHKEIPVTVSNEKMHVKIILMFIMGIMFLVTGLLSYILRSPLELLSIISLAILAIYACIEALYYRYRNTFGFAFVAIIVLIIYLV